MMILRFKNHWTMERATIPEMWTARREQGYTLHEDIDRWWRRTAVWWVIKLIPRGVKQYVVIEAATRQEDGTPEQGNPGYVTANVMLERLGVDSLSHGPSLLRGLMIEASQRLKGTLR